jgi:hypothetical protein
MEPGAVRREELHVSTSRTVLRQQQRDYMLWVYLIRHYMYCMFVRRCCRLCVMSCWAVDDVHDDSRQYALKQSDDNVSK